MTVERLAGGLDGGWWMVDDGAAAGEARWCVLSNLVFSDDYTDHIYYINYNQ